MSAIRPGLGVEFIFQSDYVRDRIRVIRAIIYDVIGDKIILSQPSKSLMQSDLKKDILVTYMVRTDDRGTRYGFKANIIELRKDYEIAAGQRGPAVVIRRMSAPETFEIRSSFRLPVPSSSGLELYVRGQKMNLIDISLGGAKFSHPELPSLQPEDRTSVKLRIDDQTFQVEAEVLRVWSPGVKGGHEGLKFCTLKFINAGRDILQILGNKIFTMERKMLAEGKR